MKGKSYPCNRLWRSIGLWDVKAPTFYWQPAQRWVRFSALCTGHPLPPGRLLVLISVGGWVDPRALVWLEGLGQLKNPMTSLGIEPATFRPVAYCLKQVHYRVPLHNIQRRLLKRLCNLTYLRACGKLKNNHTLRIFKSTHRFINLWIYCVPTCLLRRH
jgi:hypothetical protein